MSKKVPFDVNNNNFQSVSMQTNPKAKKFFHFSGSSKSVQLPSLDVADRKTPETVNRESSSSPQTNDSLNDSGISKTPIPRCDETGLIGQRPVTPIARAHPNGTTVSVSTCHVCGKESTQSDKYSWEYFTNIKSLRGKRYRHHRHYQHHDELQKNQRRSTPCNPEKREKDRQTLTPTSLSSLNASRLISTGFRGCHICKEPSKKTTNYDDNLNSKCPYSIALGGSLHSILHQQQQNRFQRQGYSNTRYSKPRKGETKRSLIMIFTISSILIFLMISYYGAIIYLRMKNSSLQSEMDLDLV